MLQVKYFKRIISKNTFRVNKFQLRFFIFHEIFHFVRHNNLLQNLKFQLNVSF